MLKPVDKSGKNIVIIYGTRKIPDIFFQPLIKFLPFRTIPDAGLQE